METYQQIIAENLDSLVRDNELYANEIAPLQELLIDVLTQRSDDTAAIDLEAFYKAGEVVTYFIEQLKIKDGEIAERDAQIAERNARITELEVELYEATNTTL